MLGLYPSGFCLSSFSSSTYNPFTTFIAHSIGRIKGAMDRLLSSSSSLPSLHTNLRPSTFLPRAHRFESQRFNFLPLTRCHLKWGTSFSSNHENPSPLSSSSPFCASSTPPNNLPSLLPSQAASPDRSMPESRILNQITTGDSKKPRVRALCCVLCNV